MPKTTYEVLREQSKQLADFFSEDPDGGFLFQYGGAFGGIAEIENGILVELSDHEPVRDYDDREKKILHAASDLMGIPIVEKASLDSYGQGIVSYTLPNDFSLLTDEDEASK